MLKLYKRIGGVLRYHEAWATGNTIIEHWGVVGERGQTTKHKLPKKADGKAAVNELLKGAVAEGYVPVDKIGQAILLIEYTVAGFGTQADLEKRYALENRMNETLGWAGLGHCDGGSVGSGTMVACCYVADFEVAKRVIEADLARTQFSDFTRIYREDVEPDRCLSAFGSAGHSQVTAFDWQTCHDPEMMVRTLPADRYQRAFRQFITACARRVWHLLPPPARAAVEGQERFLAGQGTAAEVDALLEVADTEALAYYSGGRSPDARAYAESAIGVSPSRPVTQADVLSVSSCAASAMACAAADSSPDGHYDRVYDAARHAELAVQADLLRGSVSILRS